VALGLGVLAIAVLCLPFIGYGTFVLSGLGLLFGLWGLCLALRRSGGSPAAGSRGRGLGYALAGTVVCLGAQLLALLPFLLGAD
jgi:hypothetical protein